MGATINYFQIYTKFLASCSGGLSNFLYYVSLPGLDDIDEDEEQQQQRQQANVNAYGKDVIATATLSNSNLGYICGDAVGEAEDKSVGVNTELASNDDDDDVATSAKQAPKRQRFDSDSGDSSSLKRMHAPKQEPREVGQPKYVHPFIYLPT